MPHDPPRPVVDALRVLLASCLRAAEERDDVRRSLETLGRFLQTEAANAGRASRGNHGVLTPAARVRSEPARGASAATTGGTGERLTAPLSTVVTRARWKATACRLSVERCGLAGGDEDRTAELEALRGREASLRARLKSLPDTSTWMLDMPFGKRASEPGAFDVPEERIAGLAQVADCYDTVATAAEVAMELDEAGAFADGPAPAFLYLMAEAQSALLSSLGDAPTRVDSDQRDIFLWLKDQTTRYRIYVDRYMRLDDPADPSASKDLVERVRRSARDVVEDRKRSRSRRDALSKIRYHVKKIAAAGSELASAEVDSLGSALEAWTQAGFEYTDRKLGELLGQLRKLDVDGSSGVGRSLIEILLRVPSREVTPAPRGPVATPSAAPEARSSPSAEDLREQLGTRHVGLLLDLGAEVDIDELTRGIGASDLEVARVDLSGDDASGRREAIDAFLDSGADLFLLGVKLPPDEYGHLKERCLDMDALFVRLPGALDSAAVLHQVSRQVGWRLRAQAPEPRD